MDIKLRNLHLPAVTLFVGILLWTWLFSPCIKWLGKMFCQGAYFLNALFLLLFFILVLKKIEFKKIKSVSFQVNPFPVCLFFTGVSGFLYVERCLDIDVLSCLFFGIGTLGLAGLFISKDRFKHSFLVCLLFVFILPFSYHLETFIGFPLRVFSAKAVHQFFQFLGQASIEQATIILIENKMAYVDLPCSGLKSLWIGSLFFIFLSVVENHRISFKWFLGFLFSILVIIAANFFRIMCLVSIHYLAIPTVLKDMVHIPIGLIGFIVTSTIIFWICRNGINNKSIPKANKETGDFKICQAVVMIAVMVFAIFIYQPKQYAPKLLSKISFLESVNNHMIPLSAKEKELFLHHGVTDYQKTAYQYQGIESKVLLVKAKSWRGHHHPEQCIVGQGNTIEDTEIIFVDSDSPIRLIRLKNNHGQAAYWFVSKEGMTDDYTRRVWSGFWHPDQEWIMVTICFDKVTKLNDITAIVESINKKIKNHFENEVSV